MFTAVDHVSLKVEEGKSLGIAGEIRLRKVEPLALSLMGYYFLRCTIRVARSSLTGEIFPYES